MLIQVFYDQNIIIELYTRPIERKISPIFSRVSSEPVDPGNLEGHCVELLIISPTSGTDDSTATAAVRAIDDVHTFGEELWACNTEEPESAG